MTTLDAFYAAAWATTDDTPHLVLADFLDEHGDDAGRARAEIIRLECELAQIKSAQYNDGTTWDREGKIANRLAALKSRHTGPCPDCTGQRSGTATHASVLNVRRFVGYEPCPTCVLSPRVRWDREACPGCDGGRIVPFAPCEVCDGLGDLFLRYGDGTSRPARDLLFDRGLILVSARLEECIQEYRVRCCCCDGRGLTQGCSACGSSGEEIMREPTAWASALLGRRADCGIWIEDVEPMEYEGRFGFPSGTVPPWLAQIMIDASRPNEFFQPSPAAARLALARALTRHLRAAIRSQVKS